MLRKQTRVITEQEKNNFKILHLLRVVSAAILLRTIILYKTANIYTKKMLNYRSQHNVDTEGKYTKILRYYHTK